MYDADLFDKNRPNVGVTVVPFIYDNKQIKTLAYKRKDDAEVFQGYWSLPNCFFDRQKHWHLDDAVFNALSEKTDISIPHFEKFNVYSGLYIDPERITTLNIAYMALLRHQEIETIEPLNSFETQWVDVETLFHTKLAFNHNEVLIDAYNKLCNKAGYSCDVFKLLPDEFTISELKDLIELLLSQPLDNSRFRDRIKKSGVLTPVEGKMKTANHRPAQVYKVNSNYQGDFYPKSLTKPN